MKDITAYIDENKAFVADDRSAIIMQDGSNGVMVVLNKETGALHTPATVFFDCIRDGEPIFDIALTDEYEKTLSDCGFDVFNIANVIGRFNKFMRYASES